MLILVVVVLLPLVVLLVVAIMRRSIVSQPNITENLWDCIVGTNAEMYESFPQTAPRVIPNHVDLTRLRINLFIPVFFMSKHDYGLDGKSASEVGTAI